MIKREFKFCKVKSNINLNINDFGYYLFIAIELALLRVNSIKRIKLCLSFRLMIIVIRIAIDQQARFKLRIMI